MRGFKSVPILVVAVIAATVAPVFAQPSSLVRLEATLRGDPKVPADATTAAAAPRATKDASRPAKGQNVLNVRLAPDPVRDLVREGQRETQKLIRELQEMNGRNRPLPKVSESIWPRGQVKKLKEWFQSQDTGKTPANGRDLPEWTPAGGAR